VLSSVANLVHLCGEDVGSNPAWTFSGCCVKHSIPYGILRSLLERAPGSGTSISTVLTRPFFKQ
jgi:hypothetical protein